MRNEKELGQCPFCLGPEKFDRNDCLFPLLPFCIDNVGEADLQSFEGEL